MEEFLPRRREILKSSPSSGRSESIYLMDWAALYMIPCGTFPDIPPLPPQVMKIIRLCKCTPAHRGSQKSFNPPTVKTSLVLCTYAMDWSVIDRDIIPHPSSVDLQPDDRCRPDVEIARGRNKWQAPVCPWRHEGTPSFESILCSITDQCPRRACQWSLSLSLSLIAGMNVSVASDHLPAIGTFRMYLPCP